MPVSSHDGDQPVAPVAYLPWAVPGEQPRSAEAPDESAASRRDLHPSRRGAVAPRRSSRRARGTRPVVGIDGADAAELADADRDPETGVERDERIDRLVVGRLRRSSLSVAEVRSVLVEHGLDETEVEEWIERYERLGYLDDARLAEQLVRAGAERRGRGSAAILAELSRRGIDARATRAALDELDPDLERRNALAVAERRARQLRGLDRAVAERRLTAFLQRRGYGSSVVREAVTTALSGERS